jgi:hypothetical protein
MKKLLLLLLCISRMMVDAQDASVISSSEMDNKFPDAKGYRILGSDASGYYTLRTSGPITDQETVIEQYNAAMVWLASIQIHGSQGVMGDSKLHRQTVLLNGKILTFHDRWCKADLACYFSVIPYEMSGTVLEEVVLDKQAAEGMLKTPTFKIALSQDQSKLMVLDEIPFEKGLKEKIRIKVFSTTDFQLLWSKDMQLETESERYPDNFISVDNKGTAYLYKHVKLPTKEHLYQLIIAGKEGTKTEKIDLQTYFPTDFKMVWDTDGSLMIGGTLATQGQHAGNWERVWALKANENGIVFNKVTPLSQTILRTQLSEKQAAEPNAKLSDMKLRTVLVRKSGGIMLLAEEFRSTKTATGQSASPVYEYSLEYGKIDIIVINGEGTELWSNVVQKKQNEKTMDEEKYFGSFACHTLNDKLYLVWNYTNWETLIGIPFRFWRDKSDQKIDIDNLYGKKAVHPTLLTVLNADGTFAFADRTFFSYPLADIQKANAFEMAVDASLSFTTDNGMIIVSRMAGIPVKKYKFSTIRF